MDEEMEEAKGLPVRSRLPLSLVELCIIQFLATLVALHFTLVSE